MAKRRGIKMAHGECRTTKKGVQYCRIRAGVRFTKGTMADVADMGIIVDDLGTVRVMTPGECKTVEVRGGTRALCYGAHGARFVPMSELAALKKKRRG